MTRPKVRIVVAAAIAITSSACISLSADSPLVQAKLRTVSAGYTGCNPDENVLTNVAAKADGSGTWNATCKGKTYLCSAVGTVNNSESFHCAPVAQ